MSDIVPTDNADRPGSEDPGQNLSLSRRDLALDDSGHAALQARPIVIVLGMHRSGTSLLSNMLHVLGVDMADTTDHVSPKNPGGFWERPELVAIHDEILEAIGRPISLPSHVLPFPPAWWRSKQVQALKLKLADYVRQELAKSSNPWGFKDPRTCRLLPLWWEIFRDLNLEPVYVVATRSPAESSVSMSQKSSARRLSVANGELMWLSYNYDIARHVTLKQPVVTVDYDEWFEDAVGVAQRLARRFGIGEHLSPEELDDCLSAIVHREYRHETAKPGTDRSLATMFYKAVRGAEPGDDAALRALRGQSRLVDMFFRSVTPIVEDLDLAASERASLVADRDEQLVQLKVAGEQSAKADAELEKAKSELAEAVRAVEERAQEVAGLTGELNDTRSKSAQLDNELLELRAAALAAQRAQEAEVAAVRVEFEAEVAAVRVELEAEVAAVRVELEAEVAAVRVELEAEVAAGRVELEAEVAVRMEREAEVAAVRAELEAELHRSSAAAQRALEVEVAAARELESEHRRSVASLKRERKRSRELLKAAKEWRGAYAAEHGDPAERLREAKLAAELQHKLNSAERRLGAAEERQRAFVAALEERDMALAAMRSQAAVSTRATEHAEGIFSWPSDGAPLGVTGQIDRVDAAGIAGRIKVEGRRDIVPVVEARAGESLVVAQNCTPDEAEVSADGNWRFLISWSRFEATHAGKDAVILVAGVEHEIGRAAIPTDLSALHQSPAVRAAIVLGGTIEEAAEYHRWLRECETATDAPLARNYRSARSGTWPTITIVVYGGDREGLPFTIQSLQQQVYSQWEAWCLDAPADVAADDPRIRVVAASKLAAMHEDYPPGSLFTFVQSGDLISPTALLHLADAAERQSDFSLIYSDEDLIERESGTRAVPYMKPEWSPDLAFSQDYVSRLALIRRDRMNAAIPVNAAGVYQLMLRAALLGDGPKVHIPFVLYHRALQNAQNSAALREATQSVLDSAPGCEGAKVAVDKEGRTRVRWPIPEPAPSISLIVPTRDRVDLLRNCVDGFLHGTNYKNLEVLIVDNDSQEEATKSYLSKVATHPRVRVVSCPGPFNFSVINNKGAEQATGELIGLMNNDLKVFDPDWLREMVSHAIRPDVGIVGAKLLYEDGTIQHAGVTLGLGIPSHLYKASPGEAEGRNRRLMLPQDVSAVTAACLVIRRDVWELVGGLDEEFPVAYNDIDLCFKVRSAGYRVLWTPEAVLYHLESRSRGKDASGEKRERLNRDKARLMERWGDMLTSDPFHSPNFSASHVDSRLSFPPRTAAPWRAASRAV